ncbi:MAG TPA: histidine kinase [Gammaproteobacteria bacterium]|nr:histidine kinase [Gammaproteobacteria bacterium]
MGSGSVPLPWHRRTMLILTNGVALWVCQTASDLLGVYLQHESGPSGATAIDADMVTGLTHHVMVLPLLIMLYFAAFYIYDSVLRPAAKWILQLCLGLGYGIATYPLLFVTVAMLYGKADHDEAVPGSFIHVLFARPYMWVYNASGWSLLYFVGLLLIFNMASRLELAEGRARLERLNAEWMALKLKVLRWQLNPHFLFNCLNTVSALLKSAPDRADTVLSKFSALLRLTLREQESAYITVGGELNYINSYLDMELIRFEDRLELDIEADEDTLEACLPCFLVQPLVENAIKHGVAKIPGPAMISVSASRRDDRLVICVRNTSSRKFATPRSDGGGLGIRNLRERLEVTYPGKHTFHCGYVENDAWSTIIEIPFEREPPVEAGRDAAPAGPMRKLA